ncbi:hypothetical protein AAFF_G00020460 [Aldrovandia affinis]|uniref:Uncharacterized protein n=1 Tax=Aldrovandia affinis TaxID=143900 RepID=A0AAD7WHG3_9TELE|nr:hypothetical protein AAFF_G00020460 [Aldrovandia affinis]
MPSGRLIPQLPLRTIRQEIQTLRSASVSFRISSASQPKRSFLIEGAFTARYPSYLQRRYKHLVCLALQQFDRAKPLVLIGADHPRLITPIEPVRLDPLGGPAAIRTRWVERFRVRQGSSSNTSSHSSVY